MSLFLLIYIQYHIYILLCQVLCSPFLFSKTLNQIITVSFLMPSTMSFFLNMPVLQQSFNRCLLRCQSLLISKLLRNTFSFFLFQPALIYLYFLLHLVFLILLYCTRSCNSLSLSVRILIIPTSCCLRFFISSWLQPFLHKYSFLPLLSFVLSIFLSFSPKHFLTNMLAPLPFFYLFQFNIVSALSFY